MKWHRSVSPITDYDSKTVPVNEFSLRTCKDYDEKIKVTNLSVKKSLPRIKKQNFDNLTVYRIVNLCQKKGKDANLNKDDDPGVTTLL